MADRAASAPNPGVAKTRRLLLGARRRLFADSRALVQVYERRPPAGRPIPDPGLAIAQLTEHLHVLRADVLRQSGGGTAGKRARELTARTLLETEQALAKLAKASHAPDQHSAVALVRQGLLILQKAKSTSLKAGKALDSPWPL